MQSAPYSRRPRKHWSLRVYVRQRECNERVKGERACARFTGAVTLGCCGVNVLKAKDRGGSGHPGALTRGTLRCGSRQGASLAARRAGERPPLTAILAAAVLQL